jgi:hypothetical protein
MARKRNEIKELRQFAAVIATALVVFPLWGAWRDEWVLTTARVACLCAAPAILALGLAAPRSLRVPYLWWMRLGRLLGRLTSPVILTAFFLLVLTPVGLLRRAFGWDPMRLRRRPDGASYWIPRAPETRGRERFEQPF